MVWHWYNSESFFLLIQMMPRTGKIKDLGLLILPKLEISRQRLSAKEFARRKENVIDSITSF